MKREPISGSSNVKSIGYSPAEQLLHVEFSNGGLYEYSGVTEHEHQALMGAKSVGSHLHQHIKKYGGRRL